MKKLLNLTLVNSASQATIVTHPAPHHGDETMAVVVLGIIEGSVAVYRTRNPKDIEEAVSTQHAYIVDVGGAYDLATGRFDHHQRDFSEVRADGSKYSSAGLVWKEYGVDACIALTGCTLAQAEAAAKAVDEMLIKGIDAADYGERTAEQMSVSTAISLLNPNWNEPSGDATFVEACELAYLVLARAIQSCVAAEVGKDTVDEAIVASEAGLLLLPQFITGWLERTVTSNDPKAKDLLYGVFRNLQGQWNVQALPPTLAERSAQRKPLPETWRGLSGAKLQEITGVEDAVFCHAGGFICGARSREGAMKLAQLATVEA